MRWSGCPPEGLIEFGKTLELCSRRLTWWPRRSRWSSAWPGSAGCMRWPAGPRRHPGLTTCLGAACWLPSRRSVSAGSPPRSADSGWVPASPDRGTLLGRIRPATPASPLPPDADFAALGTPTFITPNPDFYRIDTALRVPLVDAEDWRMRVHGMVDNEPRLTYEDLLARPLLEKTITMTCVSNEVNGGLISTANFTGVSPRELVREAQVRPGADQVLSTSADGWTAGTPTDMVLPGQRRAARDRHER